MKWKKNLIKYLIFIGLIASAFIFGCNLSESDPDRIFKANIEVQDHTDSTNIRNNFEILTQIRENNGGIQNGAFVWINFRDEITQRGGVLIPRIKKGCVLERTGRINTFKFIDWTEDVVINFN